MTAETHPAETVPDEVAEAQADAAARLEGKDLADHVLEEGTIALHVQLELAAHPDPRVRVALGYHPHLHPLTQLRLAEDTGHEVQWSLAESPVLTRAAAEALHRHVRSRLTHRYRDPLAQGLLQNPRVPEEILEEVYRSDGHEWVREAVLSNPSLPLKSIGDLGGLTHGEQQAVGTRPDLRLEDARGLRARSLHQASLRRLLEGRTHAAAVLDEADAWDGDVGSLVERVEALYAGLDEAEEETLERLRPEWKRSLEELRELVTCL